MARQLLSPLRLLAIAACYVGFAVMALVIGWVLIPLGTLGIRDPRARIHRGQHIFSKWARLWIRFMTVSGLLRLRAAPLPIDVQPGRPAVIVANHPTVLDIFMVVATVPGVTFVAKSSWFRSPLTHRLLRLGHHIPGPEDEAVLGPAAGASTLERIVAQLRDGYPVMLFPEGTRSPLGGLGPFRRGAFEAAYRAQVPLVCLLLRVTPPALAKGQAWWDVPRQRVEIEMDVLRMVAPEDLPRDSRGLTRELRRAYVRALDLPSTSGAMPAGVPGSQGPLGSLSLASSPSTASISRT